MFKGQHIAVTGAAGGIGHAIGAAFGEEGAKLSLSDLGNSDIERTAAKIGGQPYICDVGDEASVQSFINDAQSQNGPIDIYISNAGVGFADLPGGHAAGGSNESWETSWQVNVMASVYAARALLPDWIARGQGRFVINASAAGLLAQVGTGSYTATKHAAVGYAEYLAIMHKDDGIKAHCICPQYVKTNMTKGMTQKDTGPDKHIEPEDVAKALIAAINDDKFLVLPHPVIAQYFQHKAADYDRYIGGMAKMKSSALANTPKLLKP